MESTFKTWTNLKDHFGECFRKVAVSKVTCSELLVNQCLIALVSKKVLFKIAGALMSV